VSDFRTVAVKKAKCKPPGTCSCEGHKPCLPRCDERHPEHPDVRCTAYRAHEDEVHVSTDSVRAVAIFWPKKKEK
jgi:hypothetical protein